MRPRHYDDPRQNAQMAVAMNPQEQFWAWFEQHQDDLFNFKVDQERTFDELSRALNRFHKYLTFEFGPEVNGRREFVISASGIKKAFPAVTALTAAAPKFDRWEIVAFRPRRTAICAVDLGGTRLAPEEVEFVLLSNGKMAGIRLFIPGFTEDNLALKQIAYLMLDEALGEYDVETKLGLIQLTTVGDCGGVERHPLPELPARFDELLKQIEPYGSPN